MSTHKRVPRYSATPAPPGPFRRRGGWGALLLALGVIGAGAGWVAFRHRSVERAAEVTALDPEEQALCEAVRRRPADVEAQQALGSYLLEQHRPYEAMWAFQDALDVRPAAGEACRGLARALIAAHLPKRALEILAACSTSNTPIQNPNAQTRGPAPRFAPPPEIQNPLEDRRVAAAAYLAQGDAAGAVGLLETAGAALQSSPSALLDLGNAEEALGDDGGAAITYQRLLRQELNSVEGNLGLGRVAARQRRWDIAFSALARARRSAPGDPRPPFQLALTLRARGGPAASSERPGGAIWLLRQVLLVHPDYGPAQLQMGLWLMRRGQPAVAAVGLERAVAAHAGGDATLLCLAGALEAAGRKAEAARERGLYFEATQQPDRAIREYQRMAALDPTRKDVPLLLSAVYTDLDMKEQAAEVVRRALERDPRDPQLLARRAMLLMMIDDPAGAADLCRRWIQWQPSAAEPYDLMGQMERAALHPAEAIRLSEEAIARDPQNARYSLDAALALNAAPTPGHLRRAAALLQRAAAVDPDDAAPHLRLGELLERGADLDGARREYQRGLDADPTARNGVYALSQLCARLGKSSRISFYAEIARVLREREDGANPLSRRLAHAPDDVDAHARLAHLLLESGDVRPALSHLERVVQLRPDRRNDARQMGILQRLLTLRED